ncbi:Flp pilus assembly protein RcpC/CpaB [Candidatus Hydrogenisulfobacillus filiaventi]|uniref:Flp pilus assembly protein RcpC/CpaB n=1 Tax=Candidatus Hydrogenisulfobacillus filiaventi TaxID=2707344 RepID=A0A6F8ZE00_9FIRM|nr:Flp pilus assembly protein RcpC/CpaB [Candidatus Hydrogenisulfobacillus filiaventi]
MAKPLEQLRESVRVNRWTIAALLVGALAIYATLQYVRSLAEARAAAARRAVPTAPVLVLRQAVAAYQPLTVSDVGVRRYPLALVPPGALHSPAALAGGYAAENLAAGTPLVGSEVFYPKSANVLAARIAPGDVAVDLPLGAQDVVDGLVAAGDRISIFSSVTTAAGQPEEVMIFNHLPVLGVNGSLSPTAPTPGNGETLILALPPAQVAKLLFAEQHGSLEVALDGPGPAAQPPAPYTLSQWQSP